MNNNEHLWSGAGLSPRLKRFADSWIPVEGYADTLCWVWTGAKHKDGYGVFYDGQRTQMAHRFIYAHLVGAIPSGLVIDHTCLNKKCVNPQHLEPVTVEENSSRVKLLNKAKRARGEYTGGHYSITQAEAEHVQELISAGDSLREVQRKTGIPRRTIQRIKDLDILSIHPQAWKK